MPWNDEIQTGGVWKPTKIGETLEGVLKDRKTLPGKNNQDYTLFTVETNEGEMKVSGAVLESKLNVKNPEDGELLIPDGTKILLTYKGKPKGTYLDYSVQVWNDNPLL